MLEAAAREVIPFRERKQDIALWIFFLVNVIFVTYQADIEQLLIRDPDNFTYPIWPPAYMIDFLHWYFEKYDPLLYSAPSGTRRSSGSTRSSTAPSTSLRSTRSGRQGWIRNWSIIWASVMLATVTVILGQGIAGRSRRPPAARTGDERGRLIVPIWVLIRMWREHPFTRPVTTEGES